jgi:hypothetical protein
VFHGWVPLSGAGARPLGGGPGGIVLMKDATRERALLHAGRIFARALERRFGGNWRPVLWSPATGDAGDALPGQLDRVVGDEDVNAVDERLLAGFDHDAADQGA